MKVPAAVLDCTLRTCISTSFADRVESLRMPTLVVGGRRDAYFPPEAVAHLARKSPVRSRDRSGVQPRSADGTPA